MKIITRHPALVEYLREQGIEGEVISHASPETVKGQDVVGVLPLSLSCLCNSFKEVSMVIPAELRGKELSLDDIKACHPVITSYKIIKLD